MKESNTHYEVTVRYHLDEQLGDLKHYEMEHVCDSFESLKDLLSNLETYQTSQGFKEYYLVYRHPIQLPSYDFITEFSRKEVYRQNIKIPPNEINSILKKQFQDQLKNEPGFNNYCIRYETLQFNTKESIPCYEKVTSTFDLRRNNLERTVKELYALSRRSNVFNLQLYQYKELSMSELTKKEEEKEACCR